MQAMGVKEERIERKRFAPELPESLAYLYDEYRKLKFSIVKKDGVMTLYPREQLTYLELDSYCKVTQSQLKPWELSIIMNIDAIFEGRNNG